MFKLFISLFLVLVSSAAFAQAAEVPTEAQINAKMVECTKQFAGDTTPAVLARSQCQLAVSITVLEFKAKASGADSAEIKRELAHQRVMLEAITASLKALAAAPKAEPKSPAVSPASPPQQQQLPPQEGFQPPFIGGAPFQVVEPVWQLQAFTKEMSSITSRLQVTALAISTQHWLGTNAKQARIIVVRNTDALEVINPNRPGVFTEFYADRNGDGEVDAVPYKGIDPFEQETVFVPTEKGDVVELVFLSPMGKKKVALPNMPLQTIWGNPIRVRIGPMRAEGSFHFPAVSGAKIH